MTKQLLYKFIDALGPSGREQPVRSLIAKEITSHVDEVFVDEFGNLIGHKKGKDIKIMLAAHMDEIALMIKEITRQGHLLFAPVGGIEPITLVGQTVSLLTKKNKFICHGVITTQELQNGFTVEAVPKMNDLYVDLGFSSKKEVLAQGLSIGDYVVPRNPTICLGKDDLVAGKALDNRVGCYALVELIKKLKTCRYDLYFVFTVQEEIGMYGAQTASFRITPDWGIAVDSTNTEANDEIIIELNKGPVLTYMDSEIISNTCLNELLEKTAQKKKIPLQKKVEEAGTTDAARIMINKTGVPSTSVSIPVRNLHSPVGIADCRDIEKTVALLYWFLKQKLQRCVV